MPPPEGKKIEPKEIATAFLKLAASGKVSEAFEKYTSQTFVTIIRTSRVMPNPSEQE